MPGLPPSFGPKSRYKTVKDDQELEDNVSQMVNKGQDDVREGQDDVQEASKTVKDGSRGLQDGPRDSQDASIPAPEGKNH